jgi:hypothetical protein
VEQLVGSPLGSRIERASDPGDPLARSGWAKSAASWPAIFAGASVAIATSLLLFVLGSGLGLAIVSPWPGRGVSATGFTINAAIWLIVTQWLSAAIGGYTAGRLRTKWVGTHSHEVFFRDTAHGLVTWSVATVVVALVLAGSAASMLGGGMRAIGGAASAEPGAAMPGVPGGAPSVAMTYDIDRLFRAPTSAAGSAGPVAANTGASGAANASAGPMPGMDMSSDPRVEAVYIAFHGLANQGVSDDDRAYLAQLVQAQAGVSAAEAQKRVDEFVTATLDAGSKARAAADTARKGAAEASIYTALAMLIGAFIASVSAAIGGRLRDEHP